MAGWGLSHHTAVPGNVVRGPFAVEVHKDEAEESQQPRWRHVATQEQEGWPQQAVQLAKHLLPEPRVVRSWMSGAWGPDKGGSSHP
jgi:hypothetical protein